MHDSCQAERSSLDCCAYNTQYHLLRMTSWTVTIDIFTVILKSVQFLQLNIIISTISQLCTLLLIPSKRSLYTSNIMLYSHLPKKQVYNQQQTNPNKHIISKPSTTTTHCLQTNLTLIIPTPTTIIQRSRILNRIKCQYWSSLITHTPRWCGAAEQAGRHTSSDFAEPYFFIHSVLKYIP